MDGAVDETSTINITTIDGAGGESSTIDIAKTRIGGGGAAVNEAGGTTNKLGIRGGAAVATVTIGGGAAADGAGGDIDTLRIGSRAETDGAGEIVTVVTGEESVVERGPRRVDGSLRRSFEPISLLLAFSLPLVAPRPLANDVGCSWRR